MEYASDHYHLRARGGYVGASVRRKEDPGLVSGRIPYVDDITLPKMLYLALVRSPYAHAQLKSIDVEPAKMEGVVMILTGNDLKLETSPLPYPITLPFLREAKVYALATDRVRYVGEPVAAVVAEDRYSAVDAAERVVVEYDPLPAVVDPEEALKNSAPKLYDDWPDNVRMYFKIGNDIGDVFKNADHVVEAKLRSHRQSASPIETRSIAASYDKITGFMTVWVSTQRPHAFRTVLADALKLPESRIRVIKPAVGGSFGMKSPLYPEEFLVPYLSMKLGRPVKWSETRTENLTSSTHSRDQVHYIKMGLRKDGKILALQDRIIADMGVAHPMGQGHSPLTTGIFLPGPYDIKNLFVEIFGVVTNKPSYGAYRGFGKSDSTFIMERFLDIVARRLHLDPVKLRHINFIRPEDFPYTSATGCLYDSGRYSDVLNKALRLADYDYWRARQKELRKEGRLIGIGVAYMLEPASAAVPNTLIGNYEVATVRIDPSGKVTLLVGTASQGQGHETTLAQVLADYLGARIEDITVVEGDTLACPYGLGTFSSRNAAAAGPAVILAAKEVRKRLLKVASKVMNLPISRLYVKDSAVHVKSHDRSVSFAELARVAYTRPYEVSPEGGASLEATKYYTLPKMQFTPDEKGRMNLNSTYPNGAFVTIVEIDPETGKVEVKKVVVVHDCGNVINPMIVEGQIHGGIAQGVAGAIYEELRFDASGQPLISNFVNYLVPTAAEIPQIEVAHHVTPSPWIPGGFKGMAEGGAVGTPPAIMNAVYDALAPFGVEITEGPMSPERVWSYISKARKTEAVALKGARKNS